ncbi:hypothetical protein FND50_21220 [Rhodococcus sp. WB9]|uniref:hypothetical protein n=1 Tax=Rhodococcus sp. WB9 TaxID=2594007 RepID=UPI001186CB3A|nr:hypothetical protein [Rhodococcus sp. WB9]QDQ93028.1 hypothetical protein FND50_21220 [Rhodococcus sp. WB9]
MRVWPPLAAAHSTRTGQCSAEPPSTPPPPTPCPKPRDDWCTRQGLFDWGYRAGGITRFFGPETEGLQIIAGWS